MIEPRSQLATDDVGIHHGTLEDYVAPTRVLGKLGGALVFDGVSNDVDCDSNQLLDMTGALTLMTWMNKTGATSSPYGHILGKNRDGSAGQGQLLPQNPAGSQPGLWSNSGQ